MALSRTPAVYMRGGTCKGLFFHERHLPADPDERDRFILSAMGSPDPYQRQLNGMGGGISSLSKIVIVSPSTQKNCDVEYLHGQVSVDESLIDYSANCGNLSAAVGPFAVEEGLMKIPGDQASVRMFNRNSGSEIHARFPLQNGAFVPTGDFAMPGVQGRGALVALDYLDPGIPEDSALFPTGKVSESISLAGGKTVQATMAYAALPTVWVKAEVVGLTAAIGPKAMDDNTAAMKDLEALRREAGVRMGLAKSISDVGYALPKVGIVGAPEDFVALDGTTVRADEYDILTRVVSVGKTHLAVPLACAMCLGAACLAEGTVSRSIVRKGISGDKIRIGTPSGIQIVGAALSSANGKITVKKTITYATARRLMDGNVYGN